MSNIEKAIREFHARAVEVERVIGALNAQIGMSPEGPLYNAVFRLLEAYKGSVGAQHGIEDWLDWWWLECGLGENPMQASVAGGEMRTIASIDDLVRMVCDGDMERGG